MIGNAWRRLILGAGILGIIIMIVLWAFGRVHAQVTPGTVNAKVDDGVGNKITSTVAGPSRGLDVNCLNCGAGGATYLDADGIANQTASAVHGQTYMYNGATWDRVRGSIAGGLQVNCVTGCAGGASTPTDAFANPVTAGLQMGFNMVYNGATWDRLRGTVAGGALVNISNASLAVTGTFFQATQPVSGTVAVSNAFLLDATFTGRWAVAYVDADAIANQTTTAVHGQLYGYNGVTWDRLRSTIANGLSVDVTRVTGNVAVTNAGLTNLDVALSTRVAEATFTGRFTAASVDADAIANETTTSIHGKCYLYNGASWDRCRGSVANGLTVSVSNATLAVTQSGTWNIGTLTSITNPVTITDGAGALNVIVDSGTLTAVTSITNTVTVQGTKSNNGGVPSTNNEGVLPCVATAVAPTYTEGNQVGCSTTLGGATRVDVPASTVSTANNDGACPSGAVNFTVAASNASRTWLAIWASPANTDDVYIKLGVTATNVDGRISPGQPINFTSGRIYTGQIDAFPNSGTQAVCLMELN